MLPDLSDPTAYHQSRLKYWCRRRRIFATESGFVGLGPNDIRIGDLVALVFGSAVPLILRRQESILTNNLFANWVNRRKPRHKDEERFYFLGQAYVHRLIS
jgi:hypothetical protein